MNLLSVPMCFVLQSRDLYISYRGPLRVTRDIYGIFYIVYQSAIVHDIPHSLSGIRCCLLLFLCFFLVSRRCCRRHSSKGMPLTWRTEQKLIRMVYFRTCGTFISDEDIVKAEAHFQATKVTTGLAAQTVISVCAYKIVLQVTFPFSSSSGLLACHQREHYCGRRKHPVGFPFTWSIFSLMQFWQCVADQRPNQRLELRLRKLRIFVYLGRNYSHR